MAARSKPSSIAVFGSSEPVEGDPLYDQARSVGRLLAGAGHPVVTGGYGGVMEGASRGAVEAGGRTVGVTCSIFREREPNPWVQSRIATADLHDRTRKLIEIADGFVVLFGKSGTLAELSFLWALHRAGCLDRSPVILLGDDWRHVLRHLVRAGILEASQFDVTRVVDTPEEALDTISLHLENRGTHG